MRAVVEKENVAVFFIFLEKLRCTEGKAAEACWAQSLGRSGNEPSGQRTLGRTPL
jgi:hypothetical protein